MENTRCSFVIFLRPHHCAKSLEFVFIERVLECRVQQLPHLGADELLLGAHTETVVDKNLPRLRLRG